MLFVSCVYAQQYNPNYNAALSKINDPIKLVEDFESLGTKSPGSAAKQQTVTWLIQEYQNLGYDSIQVDSFSNNGQTARNVIVTKPGTTKDYIVICGHYDTKNGPGANDNGSGVAAILEAARVLKDLTTTRTIQFIHFDLEEVGFIGSDHHVNQITNQGLDSNLYVVINIDQIGGTKGQPDNDKITCERDEDNNVQFNNARSWLITDTIAQFAKLYTSLTPRIDRAFLSDYIPFEKKGYVITGLYQSAKDRFSHSAADTIENMDTTSFKEAVKLTVVTAVHYAQVDQYIGVKETDKRKFALYPNPTTSSIHIICTTIPQQVSLLDILGRELISKPVSELDINLDVSNIQSGNYLVKVTFESGQTVLSRLIIE